MKFLRTAMCGVIATLLLAACGNATAGMTFKVPADYQSKINMFGMEMWSNAAPSKPSMIMLITIPKKFDPKNGDFSFDQVNVPNGSMKNAKLTGHRFITMCSNQPALKVTAESTRHDGASPAPGANDKTAKSDDDNIDMVVTGWGGKTYMAMYVHPHDQATDAAAEASLMTLCPATAS